MLRLFNIPAVSDLLLFFVQFLQHLYDRSEYDDPNSDNVVRVESVQKSQKSEYNLGKNAQTFTLLHV